MAEETKKPEAVSPEAEIKELERKLEQKKRELAEKETVLPEEKEIFREVLREHIKETRTSVSDDFKTPATAAPPDNHKKKIDDAAQKEVLEQQVRGLIEVALTKTIAEAVKIAEALSPYLLDELHDRLVDDYYDKLLALRKLESL
jgi:sugar-specific transcriptional regulator TrmB